MLITLRRKAPAWRSVLQPAGTPRKPRVCDLPLAIHRNDHACKPRCSYLPGGAALNPNMTVFFIFIFESKLRITKVKII